MTQAIKILAVDDDELILNYIKSTLSPNYQVITTPSAHQAFEMIIRFRPDLLITDIVMDELDGLALSSLVRVARGSSDIPIIVLSAHDNDEIRAELAENEINLFLQKPCRASELLESVKALIEG
ncbi:MULTISPECIES: response regulator [unclassified Marinobacterium]|uniref:response regulator n=1 Tax=unclassified Marinobacterium TaxID=2644139 RepID=UPI0015683943|nr:MULTISPECIES: response regulator [unclassified Marinobacterium]NRP10603.1 Sensor histidine kinase TodS [Marinobacterium sp. xm-g-48]NRP35969.1 Sensor histidine kinase TodS [Marinobacterium sp. xm-d-579]NRP57923.1 Sensor histidine kinase TodS [Marinobacterium sp. xm-d-510]NRP83126.1 Sensor histidine kinase TodS [Marinobacterium sp. xm-d-509]NRP94390.1 Sensor histidine kinase TodS [Marinobacterium sp. xm-g-59]